MANRENTTCGFETLNVTVSNPNLKVVSAIKDGDYVTVTLKNICGDGTDFYINLNAEQMVGEED